MVEREAGTVFAPDAAPSSERLIVQVVCLRVCYGSDTFWCRLAIFCVRSVSSVAPNGGDFLQSISTPLLHKLRCDRLPGQA